MKKIALLLLVTAVMLFITSCVTKSPFTQEEPFLKTLADDSAFVFTFSPQKFDIGIEESLGSLSSKIKRISFSMTDNDYSEYPTTFTGYNIDGAVEGNFSKGLVKTTLGILTRFEKDKGDEITFYKDSETGLEIAVPHSGIVLFSNSNVNENYKENYKERIEKIDTDTAMLLTGADAGMFVTNPRTMIDFGFNIPRVVINQIDWMLITITGDKLNLIVQFTSKSLARSFSYLIKGGYISSLKRSQQEFDISELKQQFLQDDNKVTVNNLELTEEEKEMFSPEKLREITGF